MFKEYKKLLIIHVIVLLTVIIFFEPLIHLLWEIIKKVSAKTYAGWIDSIYLQASLGQRNWLDFLMFSFLSFVLFAIVSGVTAVSYIRFFEFKFKSKLKLASDEEKQNLIEKERQKRLKRIHSKYSNRGSKLFLSIRTVWAVTTVIAIVASLSTAYFDLQLNTSFKQRLNAILPYIDENTEEQFLSAWALMKSREDFLKLNSDMEKKARENNLILPENLFK